MLKADAHNQRWTSGLTGYHYLVLAVACFGWLFDTMDQWLYVQAKQPAMIELLGFKGISPLNDDQAGLVRWWVGMAQMWMIIGWATGGLFFGMIGDRLGRTKTMAITILLYSVFTGLSGLTQTPFQFVVLRFLTGLGIGGEFAAGAALVAETFPAHARTAALGIVQATPAIGNVLAGLIYFTIGANENLGWRWVFMTGLVPILLLFFIFFFVREPEAWKESRAKAKSGQGKGQLGSIFGLFSTPELRRNTFVGLILGMVGVIGFWGIGTWSAELIRDVLNPDHLPELVASTDRKMSLCIMAQNMGGFFGVMAYSYMAQRFGRKPAFLVSLISCIIAVPATFHFTTSFLTAMILFPMMGFCLLTIFGGYAIYFPELFPTRLRATGTGFSYNVSRYLAAAAPFFFGQLSATYGIQMAALFVSSFFILGILVLPLAPETKGQPLPE
ncbi:MAG: MFS transporter [Candidatus Hydrogenedentes bacterium]|nr:MFS transporter [Candidatus Hydrogenedentota bacterium]